MHTVSLVDTLYTEKHAQRDNDPHVPLWKYCLSPLVVRIKLGPDRRWLVASLIAINNHEVTIIIARDFPPREEVSSLSDGTSTFAAVTFTGIRNTRVARLRPKLRVRFYND